MKIETYLVWEDNSEEKAEISASNMNDALDVAAQKMGFVDYADMAQELKFEDDEGLNIKVL